MRCLHEDEREGEFLGHVGGDDFVAIVPYTDVENLCQNIIMMFDSDIRKFYNEDDYEKGYLEVTNRKGIKEQFPITSISIGVVIAEKNRFSNMLEIGEVAAQVKHSAKSVMGSSYTIDRRK